ncbi:MAG: hypothetical protein KF860_09095 [Cyclobacteriaceae bacterium]|nr:hypothetical protein [Cyclobacteriaceae bacterium]
MKRIIITSCIVFFAAAMLSSCSEDDNQGPQGPAETPLKAEAGPDQTVAPFTVVTLDGSASTGPASAISYEWIITANPGNINLSSDGSQQSKATFEPKVNGIYSFTLRITSGGKFSEDQVTVTVTGALTLGGTLTETTTLVDIEQDASMPDYILSSDLIIPENVTLNFGFSGSPSITIKVTNNSGITVKAGGKLNVNSGYNHTITADTGWKGILVDGGAIYVDKSLKIDKAGASLFDGQTEAAAITFTGASPQLLKMQAVNFTNSPARDILATTWVSGANDIISSTAFSNAVPIKAPIAFVNKIGDYNQFGTYDYIHLVPSGAGTVDALPSGQYMFDYGLKYFIDGDFTAGSAITISGATILMKEGTGILPQQNLTISGSTNNRAIIKGVNGTNWKGIAFAASGQLLISHATIENAGSDVFSTGFFTSSFKAAVYFSFGNDSYLNDVTITNSGGYGVYNDSPSNNVEIQNSTFTGTTLSALSAQVDRIHTSVLGTENNFTMPAGIAAVEVRVPNSSVTPSGTWQALGGSNYYLFTGNSNPTFASGTWTLKPGVNLKFKSGKALYLQAGNFTATGTALAPITFNSEAGTAGTWAGIMAQTKVTMQFCEINNGGQIKLYKTMMTQATDLANIVFDYASGANTHVFKNNTVSGSGGYGVSVEATRQNPDVLNVANNNTIDPSPSNASGAVKIN